MSLPTELWLEIASYLERKEHLALIQVSNTFLAWFIPTLYSSIVLDFPLAYGSKNYDNALLGLDRSKNYLLQNLKMSSNLRRYIRHITIQNRENFGGIWIKSSRSEWDKIIGPICKILALCSGLSSLTIKAVHIHSHWIYYLGSLPNIQLSLRLIDASIYPDVDEAKTREEQAFNIVSLSIYRNTNRSISQDNIMSPVILGGSLQYLETSQDLSSLSDLHARAGSPPLNKLKSLVSGTETRYLVLSYFDPPSSRCLSFLRFTPNLTVLSIVNQLADDIPPEVPHLVPHLENLRAPPNVLPALAVGRPLRSVQSRDGRGSPSDYFRFEDQFGGTSLIRTLSWHQCTRPTAFLDYVCSRHPRLTNLHLYLGEFTFTREDLQAQMPEWIDRISQLKELRTLTIHNYLQATHDVTDWERPRCAILHALGSTDLNAISLNPTTIWTRDWDSLVWKPSKIEPTSV